MYFFYFNILTFLLTITIFLLFGVSLSILFFSNYLKHSLNKKKYCNIFLLVLGLTFGGNILLGYILDILLFISWYTHFVTIFIIFLITIILKQQFFLKLIKNHKKIFIQLFKDIKRKINPFIAISLILTLFFLFLNIINYSLTYFSISTTDPTVIMANVNYSLYHQKITYKDIYIGLTNWADTHYSQGFIILLTLLSVYDPNNLFIIIKFFAPILNTISVFCLYCTLFKVTKNEKASLFGLLVFISSNFINYFFVISVAATLAIFLVFIGLYFFFEMNKISKCIAGILLGSSFLCHPIIGIFFIPGILLYFFIMFLEKKKTNIMAFFSTYIIVLIPYILLFKYPLFGIYDSIFDIIGFNGFFNPQNISGLTLNNLTGIISSNLQISFYLDFKTLKSIENGPIILFYFFLPLLIFRFKKEKGKIIFFLITLIFSILFITNPIVINGVPLKAIIDQYWFSDRGLYFLTISSAFLSALAFKNLIIIIKNIFYKFEKYKKKPHQFKINFIFKIFIIYLIGSQAFRTINHFNRCYGDFWPNSVPEDYTESLLWIKQNIDPENGIIVPNTSWVPSRFEIIYFYYDAMLYKYHIELNSIFYQQQTYTYSVLNNSSFFNYDFIILGQQYLIYYESIINNSYLFLTFKSSNSEFYLFEIIT